MWEAAMRPNRMVASMARSYSFEYCDAWLDKKKARQIRASSDPA
jgi:hypothetical protein